MGGGVGGTKTPEAVTFKKICMSKRKNLDPWGDVVRRARPLDPPLDNLSGLPRTARDSPFQEGVLVTYTLLNSSFKPLLLLDETLALHGTFMYLPFTDIVQVLLPQGMIRLMTWSF